MDSKNKKRSKPIRQGGAGIFAALMAGLAGGRPLANTSKFSGVNRKKALQAYGDCKDPFRVNSLRRDSRGPVGAAAQKRAAKKSRNIRARAAKQGGRSHEV